MKIEKLSENKYFEIYFSGVEAAIDKSLLTIINDEIIKFNDEVIFFNEAINATRRLMYNTLFMGIETIDVNEESFKKMSEIIKTKQNNKDYIFIDYGRKPKAKVAINLKALKNNLVTLKLNKNTIVVNNIIFTVDTMEFLGDSLFAGKSLSFKIDAEMFTYIKRYLIGDADIQNVNLK